MQFLQPILLWGLLGISIPILIHLWRGKKGQVIHWAAMHWLSEEENAISKGIRLENVLVLLLRILLLILLVIILSQFVMPDLNRGKEDRVVHLVEPNRLLTEEYKFELQQAIEKGEEVFWADESLTPIESIDDLNTDGKRFSIQESLDKITSASVALHLYLSNSTNAFSTEFYLSPVKPTLHLGSPDLSNSPHQLISLETGKEFMINEIGVLDTLIDDEINAKSIDLGDENFSFFLGEIEETEQVFIQASLAAIQDIYGFRFVEKDQVEEARLIFDSQFPVENSSDKLYFISDSFSFSESSNVVVLTEQTDFEHSELVQTGKLPEVILERFLSFSGVEKRDVQLSKSQISSRFLINEDQEKQVEANLNLLLLGLFIICLATERYLANRQGI